MTIVETRNGKVEGAQEGSVQVWRGIPYAQPPTGNLRFMPPQAPANWEGVRDATNYGSAAAQLPGALERLFGTAKVPSSEDCLYLNVWSSAADNAKRPVLFWIHGGAFVNGSGSTPWYNGKSFAEQGDVVVVTINYRLGVLGFLHLAELGGAEYASSGNCGILDQVAALEWVRDNIGAFGGDPNNVTIFGESAGSMSVATLLAVPQAQGLFHKAILQSGAAHNLRTAGLATKHTHSILEALEFNGTIEQLKEVPVEKLLEAGRLAVSRNPNGRIFQPVVDGKALPQLPVKAVAEGSVRGVPLLIGTTLEEMKLFTAFDPTWQALDEDGIQKRCAGMVGEEIFGKVAPGYADYPAATPLEKWTRLLTDRTFWMPSIRLAEAQVPNAPVWMYRFDWLSPAFGGKLGACHALEIPFVFNNLDKAGVVPFTGDAPDRQALADAMHAGWIAFAKTGNPNTPTLPAWSAYDLTNRPTMLYNNQCKLENDPQRTERRLWDGLL
jgi:para-nitrobenzyl esterase